MKRSLGRPFSFDKGFGLFCIAVAGAFGYGTYIMDAAAAFQQISPKLWPAVLSVALAAIGIAILFEPARVGDGPPAQEVSSPAAAWMVFLALLLTIPVMILLGYLAAGIFLMGAILLLKETRAHLLRSTLCAVLVPTAVYYLFTSVFDQYLPTGMLFH